MVVQEYFALLVVLFLSTFAAIPSIVFYHLIGMAVVCFHMLFSLALVQQC